MSTHSAAPHRSSPVLTLVVAILIGAAVAFGVTAGLVSLGSHATQSTKPLVSYNTP